MLAVSALVVVGFAMFAGSRITACGCGDVVPFEGLDGLDDLQGALKGLVTGLSSMTESCESGVRSAVCTTACWMAGKDFQQALWWACFKAQFGVKGEHDAPTATSK